VNDASLYRCLASPTRLAALKELARVGELCVTDLVLATGAEQTNLSHHLAELRACGLVTARQDGKRACYRLAHDKLRAFLAEGEALAAHVECVDADACATAGCC
jgi:DNA-binding transcriptional ArsR family regulator